MSKSHPAVNMSTSQIVYLTMQGHLRSATRVLLVSVIGNSHSIGRDAATSGDVWAINAREWTQAGALAVPANKVLDVNDTSGNTTSGMLSPAVAFSNAVSSQYVMVVFVGDAVGSSGFSNNVWNASGAAGNRLGAHISRRNAAYAHLVGAGYEVESLLIWHNADPDSTATVYPGYRDEFRSMCAYAAANATDGAALHFVIGGGMTQAQLDGLANDPTITNSAIAATVGATLNRGASYSFREDFYGTGATFPLSLVDSIHVDSAGTRVQGGLQWPAAFAAARASTDYQQPYAALPFFAALDGLFDFNAGAGFNLVNSAADRQLLNPASGGLPRVRWDAALGRYTYQRPSGTSRIWQLTNVPITASYTKLLRVRLVAKDVSGGLINDGASSAANRTSLQYLQPTNVISAGHGSTGYVTFTADDMALNSWHTLAVTYDAATTTMRLYLDGVLKNENISTPVHAASNYGYLGGSNNAGLNPFQGDMSVVMLADKALSGPEVLAAHTLILAGE